MANLSSTTSRQATRNSSLSAQSTTTPSPNAETLLRKVNHELQKHRRVLYRQLRGVGKKFDPDVLKIISGSVDKVSGGMPWPVGLALQAVLFIADNALQVQVNATTRDSMASMVQDLKQKLERLGGSPVPDNLQITVNEITLKLLTASAVVHDLVERTSMRTCRICLHAFVCAQCNAKKLSDISADLEKLLGSIRDIITEICTARIEHPSDQPPELPAHLVGMDERALKVMEFLRGSGGRTRVVGLHGEGGIGKTTLMRVVETKLRDDSPRTYRMASVEVGMHPPAFTELQKKLHIQLSNGNNVSFSSQAQGKTELKNLMKRFKGEKKKICVFLDNVWDLRHLVELLPQPEDLMDALPCGSYLLISSRSKEVAKGLANMVFMTQHEQNEGYLDYHLPKLSEQEAEHLFLRKANREGEEKPLQRDDLLVQNIVPLCGGLPLALTVYGSYFSKRETREWGSWNRVLRKLKQAEDLSSGVDRVFQKLKDSVFFQPQGLQDAFLDVALLCRSDFFFDVEVKLVMEEDDHLDRLVDQSLAVRGEWGKVEIHDLLLAVAKQMAQEKNISFVTDRTSKDEMENLLPPHPQVCSIRAFDEAAWCEHAENSYPSSAQIQDVRYLKLNADFPMNQRREFSLMVAKHCHKLWMLELEAEDALQEQISWIENLRHLRSLSLQGDCFASISKITSTLRCLSLTITGCKELQWPVGQLGSLTTLDLSGCSSLVQLPKELGQLGSLTTLDLSGCSSLVQLPKEQLAWLDLSKCGGWELPKELGRLSRSCKF